MKRTEYQVLSCNEDGYLSLMLPNGDYRDDLKLPDETEDDEETSKRITDGLESGKDIFVSVLSAMNIEKVIECQEKN